MKRFELTKDNAGFARAIRCDGITIVTFKMAAIENEENAERLVHALNQAVEVCEWAETGIGIKELAKELEKLQEIAR